MPRSRWIVAIGLAGAGIIAGCGRAAPPVQPGPPIVAERPPDLGTMVDECDAMIGAIRQFQACPNLEYEDREGLDGWIERAGKDLEAGRKAETKPEEQKVIALKCQRATRSVQAATERCNAGPEPKDAWYPRHRR